MDWLVHRPSSCIDLFISWPTVFFCISIDFCIDLLIGLLLLIGWLVKLIDHSGSWLLIGWSKIIRLTNTHRGPVDLTLKRIQLLFCGARYIQEQRLGSPRYKPDIDCKTLTWSGPQRQQSQTISPPEWMRRNTTAKPTQHWNSPPNCHCGRISYKHNQRIRKY